jgi:predicted MFS family arabinose efflux permease
MSAVFGVFALNGFIFASWVSRLPATRDALGLDPAGMGLVLFVGAAGSIVALPLTGAVVERVGTVTTTRGASLVCALGFGAVALGLLVRSPGLVAGALFVAAAGIGSWDVAMNLQGTVVERALSRAVMPRLHAGFSLGSVAGAGVGIAAAAAGVPAPAQVVAVVAACAGAAWLLTLRYLPDAELRGAGLAGPGVRRGSARSRPNAFRAWLEPRTVLIGLMVLAAALTEGSATDWLALAVVDGFGVPDALGALAFGAFVLAMTLMRFAGTRLLDRYGRVAVLRLCAGIGLVGLGVFTLVPSLPLALAGAGAWGVGAALGFPVGMSAAADEPVRAAARVSVVSSAGYVAFLAGPPLIGLLAHDVGYRGALLVIAAPLVASLLLSRVAAPLHAGGREPPGLGAALPARPGQD